MQSPHPVRAANPELVDWVVRLQCNSTSAPTLVEPAATAGITVARSNTGVYTLTWDESPGQWVGMTWGLEDTTPANVHDHQLTADSYAAKVLTFTLTDQNAGTPQLVDLTTTSFMVLRCSFKRTDL